VYCNVQHNEFTEVQGDLRDPLVGYWDQRQKQAIVCLVVVERGWLVHSVSANSWIHKKQTHK
jgi:hypothetical protein